MQGRRYWIESGIISSVLNDLAPLSAADERKKFESGHVRLTTGDRGTEIKWHVQTPCLASIFAAMDWLSDANLPLILRFYASGWFEEFHQSHHAAIRRLEDIVARGDRHFTSKTLVKQFEINEKPLPTLLTQCINKPNTALDYAVECAFEDNTEQFTVKRIGPKSVISRVWGPFPSSFPCQSTGQYGQTVSQAYREVLTSGKPRYDHVLASMRMPDNVLFWVPYHRLVMPKLGRVDSSSVLVISELSKVDIQLI